MTITNGYCTEAELRSQLGDQTDALAQADLERAVNATSRAIDRFCGRRFWQDPAPVARVYRPDDAYVAWVHDISTTTGLVISTDTTGDGSWATTWSDSDYQLEPLDADADETPYAWWRITAIGTRTFPVVSYRTTLRVTAQFGWSAVPDEVTEACLIRAAAIFKRKEAIFGIAGENSFGTVRISRRMDPDVADLLGPLLRLDMKAV